MNIGNRILFPGNEIGEYYRSVMASQGVSQQTYSTCLPHYRTHGAYRRLLQHAEDFDFSILAYNHPDQELANTEIAKLKRDDKNSSVPADTSIESLGNCEKLSEEYRLKALALKFTMPPGTYATMFLRELCKESTDQQYQAQRTAAAQYAGLVPVNTDTCLDKSVAVTVPE